MILKIILGAAGAAVLYIILSNVLTYMFWRRRDNLTLEEKRRVSDAVQNDWPFGRPQ